MPWDFYSQDFPDNRYCMERYDELCAIEIEIALNSDRPQTWIDVRREIQHHFTRHPWRQEAMDGDEYLKPVEVWKRRRAASVREWREHLETLLELRRVIMKERNGTGEIVKTRRNVCGYRDNYKGMEA